MSHRVAPLIRAVALLVTLSAATRAARAQHIAGSGKLAKLPAPVSLDTTGRFLAAYSRVGDDLFIGGQPTEKALRELKDQGVTTVVNLRMPEEMARVSFDEKAFVESLGMKYVHVPVRDGGDHPYSPATVTAFAEVMARATGKVLLHCTIAWRASHLWAAYLIRERGVDVDAALANARAINLMDTMRSMSNGRQPVEDFLNRDLPTLGRPPQQPKRPAINGGLPSVSPDGKWIAFVRQGDGVTPGVYMIGVDGKGERRLADPPDGPVHWLPDGSGVYFGVGKFTDDSSNVMAVRLAGGAATLIERIPGRDAVLTGDMKGIYAAAGKWPNLGLVHIPVGSGQVHQITAKPGAYFNIDIGPQERLAFTHADSGMKMQIWATGAGKGFKQLSQFPESDGAPQWPSWSPDGSTIAVQAGIYQRNEPSKNTAHIWLVDVASGRATKLAAHERPYLDETPAYFPDGKRIAFQSDRTGRMEVWVMNADGTGARQITR